VSIKLAARGSALVLAAALGVGTVFGVAATGAVAQEAQTAPPAGAAAAPDPGAPEEDEAADSRTVADWYALGGWIMHFLVACSMVVVALVLERTWSLRRGRVIPRRFRRQVRDLLLERDIPGIRELCAAGKSSIARVMKAGFIHFDGGLARVEDAIETAGAHEQTILRRNLGLLGALANIATMLGLLGTVLGMIESFDLIAKTGTGDARVVAAGIFQALVTTAAGLMVGIPTIAFYSFFRRRTEVLVIELEEVSFGIMQSLAEGEDGKELEPAEV
jgi:biopolymer transport protein ExbB